MGDRQVPTGDRTLPAEHTPDPLQAALARTRDGDPDAFTHLYRYLHPRIQRTLIALVGPSDADDIASETWTQIARDLPTFRGPAHRLAAWAITIARHRAIDHHRRQSRIPIPMPTAELPHPPSHDDPAQAALDYRATRAVLDLITTNLTTEQAQAVFLRIIVGFDTATTSQYLGKSPTAIRAATHRGLRRLADHITHNERSHLTRNRRGHTSADPSPHAAFPRERPPPTAAIRQRASVAADLSSSSGSARFCSLDTWRTRRQRWPWPSRYSRSARRGRRCSSRPR